MTVPLGRLLGVDFGDVRVGLAITDPERIICSPLATLERRGADTDARFFQELVAKENIAAIVVGLPIHLDGREGEKAVAARKYGAWLAKTTQRPVFFWDERFSTVEAESALRGAGLSLGKRKARRDQLAAQILLQNFVDAGCPPESAPKAIDD
jgi:putative Holliday junction resolvase